jgi:hypothetical protein
MSARIFLVFLFLATVGVAQELPKACLGSYGGEMPSYSVEVNGESIEIDKHDVFITIGETEVVYTGGSLELNGIYTVFKQSKNEYVIKTVLTNGKSLEYQMDFIWNKKENKIYMTSKNGQSEAVLERLDD